MISEFLFKSEIDLNKLEEINDSVKDGERIVVVKDAINLFTLKRWEKFIKNRLNLKSDRRHYNIDGKLVLDTWWNITYDPEKQHSYTYSKTAQPLHNDNAWFSDPAEINFFFMEKQAFKGGESIFYPIRRILNDLQSEEPQLFDDLQTTIVTIQKGNHEYSNTTSILKDGKIFWNYYRTIKKDNQIRKMCDYFFSFLKMKESSKSIISYRMDSGDILFLNDLTMLHGRLAFEAHSKGDRSLFQSMWRI